MQVWYCVGECRDEIEGREGRVVLTHFIGASILLFLCRGYPSDNTLSAIDYTLVITKRTKLQTVLIERADVGVDHL